MKKMMKALVLVIALCLVLTGCQYLPEIPGLNQNPEHVHTLIHNAEKAPTCVNNGILEHWYCPGCNARFSDEAATTEVTFADLEVEETGHVAGADDGDCTTAVDCTVCGKVATPAAKAHTPEKDDGDCTTNVMCTQCAKIAVPAKAEHEANEDDGDCTTAVTCAHCDHVFVPAAEAHTPGDEATCTTNQICTVCETVLVEAPGHADANEDAKCDTCGKFFLPEAGTAFKLTLFQNNKGAKYYFTGAMSGYYFATNTDVSKAVDVYLEDAEGGYYLYFMNGETKNYIYAEKSGSHNNIKFGATQTVWTYDEDLGVFITNLSGSNVYMGTYGTYVTISLSYTSYINASNVDKSQFAARPVVVAAADAE